MSNRPASATERFVGRAHEFRRLDAVLAASSEGRGALVAVSGDAGIGKSQFCEELSGRARRQGFTTATARCWDEGGAPAFWPWQPILRELCGDAAVSALTLDDARPGDRDRFARFEAVVHHLAEACARAPVCVVIDDVHAADAGTVLLARFVAQSLPGRAFTMVLSRRTGEPAGDEDLSRLLDDIETEATPIVLRPFDLEETTAFLAAHGLDGLDRLDHDMTTALHRVTGGNPLFLRRVVALGTPSPDTASLEAGVQAAIGMALARLHPDARWILQTSAVLGPTPSVAAAAALAGTEPGAVLDAVDAGTAAGLVVAEGTNRFAFGHELIRAALEEALGGTARLDAHAAAAALVGVDGAAGAAGAEVLARRAHHAVAAAPRSPDDARHAVAVCDEAAAAMSRAFGYEQADALLTTAVELHERSPIGRPSGGLLVRWAQVALRCGRMLEARDRFDRAAAVTRSEDEPVLFAEAALGLGGHGVKEHRIAGERARVLGLQRAALDGVPPHAVSLRCRLEARLAAEAVVDGAPLELLLGAVDATRRCGDPIAVAEALLLWHAVVLTPAHTRSRLAIADELIVMAGEAGSSVLGLTGGWYRAVDLLHLGDARAVAALEEVRARARTFELRHILANIAVLDAMLLIRAGRLDEAAAAAERARTLGEAAGEVNALNYHGAQILGIRWIEGRAAEASELAEQVAVLPAVVETDFAFQATAAAFHAHAGRLGRARAMATELAGDDPAKLPQSSSWLVGMAALAEVAAAVDNTQLAGRVYDLLAPYADLPTLGGFAVLCLGSTERPLGVAARAVGDLDRAVGHFERAIEENRRLGHLPMAIIGHADLAAALAQRDREADRERARALYDRAITEASRIGMTVRATSWQEALAALPARRPRDGTASGDAVRRGTLHLDGKRWVIALDGRRVRVPNLVGVRYLAELLTRPGRHIPALTLASEGMAPLPPGRHDVLDDEARAAYAARARELTSELEEAEADNDLARAEQRRVELDALVDEIESASGLGGRSRAFSDPGERARSSVSKAIKRAIDVIDDASPAIADALRDTVHCGVHCAYVPDPKTPVTWSLGPAEDADAAEPIAPAEPGAHPVATGPPATGTIGGRGQRAAQRWFVGRDEEVDLVRSALRTGDRPFSVLYVHGPGGVGKTMLLGSIAAAAATAGARVVRLDMHTVDPSSSAFLDRFAAELDGTGGTGTPASLADARPIAVLVDTFERAESLAGWLWEGFVADLPANALVVIASRNPPPSAWRADPGWQQLARVVPLDNLSPDEARHYLELRDVEASLHDELLALTHGHPLALSLVVDVLEQRPAAERGAGAMDLADAPDVVQMLVERFVGAIPDPRRREALAVCAHARSTTEDLLRAAMGHDDAADAAELLAWLRSLSFVEEGRYGLFPHDLARDVLDADLRWRDPSGYEDLHRRVRAHVVGRIRGSEGGARRKAATDVIYLHRLNPVMAPLFDWGRLGSVEIAPVAGDADRELVLAMAERREGPAETAMVRHWLDRQPESFLLFRVEHEVVGFTAFLRLDRAELDDIDADPGTRAARSFWADHDPPRPGEVVSVVRFVVDGRPDPVGPRPVWEGFSVAHILHTMETRRLAWDFVAAFRSHDVDALFDYIDYQPVPEAGFTSGGRRHVVFAHDWRRVGWEDFIMMMGQRELDDGSGVEGPAGIARPEPLTVLSREELRDAVRRALRDRHRPDRLATNPLARSRSVRERLGADGGVGAGAAAGATGVAVLIDEAAAALAADPHAAKAHRAIDRTYLRPAPTQEKAAEVLGLPFSTYRDHLDRGISRIVEWLWQRELHPDEHEGRQGRQRSGTFPSGG